MTCNEVGPFIARRADDEASLDENTRTAVEAHLVSCVACRTALETQRMVSSVLRTRPADQVSPAFAVRLSARLDDVSGWFGIADWRTWTLRLAPLAAGLALITILGIEKAAPPSFTIEDWTISASDTSSPAALLWRADVSPEWVMESMVTGEVPAATEGIRDVR